MTEWTKFHDRHSHRIELVAGIDCWIWMGCIHPGGHGRISFRSYGYNYAHRAAYAACFGDIPDGMLIRHLCGNPACVRPGHLKPGTSLENSADMVAMGNAVTDLSPDQVRAIRREYDEGLSLALIARKHGIAYGTVYPIVCYKSFAHIDPEAKGRHKMRVPRKLNADIAREIRERLQNGDGPQSKLAAEYNVASSVISRINTGKRWAV